MYVDVMDRTCTKCGITQAETEFYFQKGKRRSSCRTCGDETRRAYYQANKEKWRGYRLAKPRAGTNMPPLTVEQWREHLEAAGYRCEICDVEVLAYGSVGDRARLAHIDHDHETGRLRGVLCMQCNNGLGFVEGKLDRVANYLERWS